MGTLRSPLPFWLRRDSYENVRRTYAGPIRHAGEAGRGASSNAGATPERTRRDAAFGPGIAVDAESGWRDWAAIANRNKPYAIMDFVAQYNGSHTAKFRQLQYDIEPYLLPSYETNKATVLTEYIDFVNELVARDTYGLGIQMVIPHFYGSQDGWTPISLMEDRQLRHLRCCSRH